MEKGEVFALRLLSRSVLLEKISPPMPIAVSSRRGFASPRCPAFDLSLLLGLLTCLGLLSLSTAAAQIDSDEGGTAEETITVLPVGTFHFTGAPDFNDPMAPEQQAEIRAVVDSLSAFRPTKVAVERERTDSTSVDSLYQAYRAGRFELPVNEVYQLGFRLARRRGHDRVYPIDYKLAWPMDTVMTWARENQPSFVRFATRWQKRVGAIRDSLHRHGTIREILLHINSNQYLRRIQAARMRTLEVGAAENYLGVEPPASVARRNMHIFANLLAVAEAGDRVLIIYGNGHSHYFREYVRGHPQMELARPKDYL